MAGHDLIETYLHQLRASLRWRADVDDLVDEAADHLHQTTALLVRAGADPAAAQAETLARFGDPTLVARCFARTAHGGLAMPTRLTVAAGKVGRAAAVLWLLAAAGVWIGGTDLLTDWNAVSYAAWGVLVTLAGLATTLMLAGLLVRSGGLRGWLPAAVLLAAGAGTVLLAVATWAWPLGTGLLAVAAGLVVWRVHAVTPAGAWRDWLMMAGWPIGVAVFAGLTWLQVGPAEPWGDYPVAFATGFATGAVLAAVGVAGVSRRLCREHLPDTTAPLPAAAR